MHILGCQSKPAHGKWVLKGLGHAGACGSRACGIHT